MSGGTASGSKRPLQDVPTPDLLRRYAAILAELRARGVVRTSNAPLGDYAEWLALRVYGGTLAPNSAKSYDIATAGRRIQVKARTWAEGDGAGGVFSVFRTFDFDIATLLVVRRDSYEILSATEVLPDVIKAAARWSNHVRGWLLPVKKAPSLGVDVTMRFQTAGGQDPSELIPPQS